MPPRFTGFALVRTATVEGFISVFDGTGFDLEAGVLL
jgi:hypothetical protein